MVFMLLIIPPEKGNKWREHPFQMGRYFISLYEDVRRALSRPMHTYRYKLHEYLYYILVSRGFYKMRHISQEKFVKGASISSKIYTAELLDGATAIK